MIIQVCNVYILENTLQIHGGIWKIQVCNVYNLESTLPNFETCGGVDVRRLMSLWIVTVFSLIGCERVMHIIGALIGPYVGPNRASIGAPIGAPVGARARWPHQTLRHSRSTGEIFIKFRGPCMGARGGRRPRASTASGLSKHRSRGRGAPPGSLYGGAIGNPTWDSLMGPAGDPARPPAGLPIMLP